MSAGQKDRRLSEDGSDLRGKRTKFSGRKLGRKEKNNSFLKAIAEVSVGLKDSAPVIGILIALGGLVYGGFLKLSRIEAQLEAIYIRFDELGRRLDERSKKVDERFNDQNKKFDDQNKKVEDHNKKFDDQNQNIRLLIQQLFQISNRSAASGVRQQESPALAVPAPSPAKKPIARARCPAGQT